MRIRCDLILALLPISISGGIHRSHFASLDPSLHASTSRADIRPLEHSLQQQTDRSARALIWARNHARDNFLTPTNPYNDLLLLTCEGILDFGEQNSGIFLTRVISESCSTCESLYLLLARTSARERFTLSMFPAINEKQQHLLDLLDHIPSVDVFNRAMIAQFIYQDIQSLQRLTSRYTTHLHHLERTDRSERRETLKGAIDDLKRSRAAASRFMQDWEKALNTLSEALDLIDVVPDDQASELFHKAVQQWLNCIILEELIASDEKYSSKFIAVLGANSTFFHHHLIARTDNATSAKDGKTAVSGISVPHRLGHGEQYLESTHNDDHGGRVEIAVTQNRQDADHGSLGNQTDNNTHDDVHKDSDATQEDAINKGVEENGESENEGDAETDGGLEEDGEPENDGEPDETGRSEEDEESDRQENWIIKLNRSINELTTGG